MCIRDNSIIVNVYTHVMLHKTFDRKTNLDKESVILWQIQIKIWDREGDRTFSPYLLYVARVNAHQWKHRTLYFLYFYYFKRAKY